ncbi:uncharacterized protein [Palaemon carinicauda]|uniref:uncharacterized protein n=1 Tax=Palaemon carinicauda TaxID=392227 RepID=UPI0035B5761A
MNSWGNNEGSKEKEHAPDYENLEASFQASVPLLENGLNIDALRHTYLGSHRTAEDFLDLEPSNYRSKDPSPRREETRRRKRRSEGLYEQESCSYHEPSSAPHPECFRLEAAPSGTLSSNLDDLDLGSPQHMEQFDEKVTSPAHDHDGVTRALNTKIKTTTRRGERGPKSWEFLVRLLANEKTNPTLIRWDDSEEATFLLVQPTIIAQMWGARSENPNLSYNNFARALRYHYNSGTLEAVSERQFMYKCGPPALEYYTLLMEEKECLGEEGHFENAP